VQSRSSPETYVQGLACVEATHRLKNKRGNVCVCQCVTLHSSSFSPATYVQGFACVEATHRLKNKRGNMCVYASVLCCTVPRSALQLTCSAAFA